MLFYWLMLVCSFSAGVRAGMVLFDPCVTLEKRGLEIIPACHAGPGVQNLVGVIVFKLAPQFASPAFRFTVAEQHERRNASPRSGISESARRFDGGLPQSLQGVYS
jgi:hypothetical protein